MEKFKEVNRSPMAKRVVLWIGAFLILAASLVFCTGGDAKAAPKPQPEPPISFTVEGSPTEVSVSGGDSMAEVTAAAAAQCWAFDFGPWVNKDGAGFLRYGYGEDVTACTNSAATKWVSIPVHDAYYWLGYWSHDWTKKSRSALNYSFLRVNAQWRFVFKPTGLPLLWKEPLLRCELKASNHTAYCERSGY